MTLHEISEFERLTLHKKIFEIRFANSWCKIDENILKFFEIDISFFNYNIDRSKTCLCKILDVFFIWFNTFSINQFSICFLNFVNLIVFVKLINEMYKFVKFVTFVKFKKFIKKVIFQFSLSSTTTSIFLTILNWIIFLQLIVSTKFCRVSIV